MRTSADPEGRTVLGTLNNCSGGVTPWGTVLSGEENIDQYFEASSGTLPARYAESYERYGFQAEPERGWGSVDERFDLSKEPHEAFRFGWIVEVDPYDKKSTPRKQTMLGRFKHEGANVVISRTGHAVAYMGDDEKGEYLYKFVSAETMRTGGSARARRRNMQLLTKGTLYVGALTDGKADPAPEYDGDGHWIPLCSDTESYVDGMSVADVLIDTRLAADTKRATRMDRPEDVDVNPVNGRVYACLTNNDKRGSDFPVDEPNPIGTSQTRASLDAPLTNTSGNRNGYVLEMMARDGDHDGRDFTWRLMLVCGDPEAPETYFAGFPKDKVSPISCPDNVAFDAEGNLWISTDGNKLGSNDGLFRVPTAGPRRGQVRQFLTVPVGAETCGPVITRDQHTVFVAVQHPGEDDAATFETPVSTWPNGTFPRPSVVTAYLEAEAGRDGLGRRCSLLSDRRYAAASCPRTCCATSPRPTSRCSWSSPNGCCAATPTCARGAPRRAPVRAARPARLAARRGRSTTPEAQRRCPVSWCAPPVTRTPATLAVDEAARRARGHAVVAVATGDAAPTTEREPPRSPPSTSGRTTPTRSGTAPSWSSVTVTACSSGASPSRSTCWATSSRTP